MGVGDSCCGREEKIDLYSHTDGQRPLLQDKKLVNFPKISTKYSLGGKYHIKTVSINDTIELFEDGKFALLNAKTEGSWSCFDGLLQMRIGETRYSAELSYDGLKLKLFEPFNEVKDHQFFLLATKQGSDDNDEYKFSDLDVKINCKDVESQGGKSKREYPDNLIRSGDEDWNKWTSGQKGN